MPHFRTESLRAPLISGLLVCILGCPPPTVRPSMFTFSRDQRDLVWEKSVAVLHQRHFQIARESKLEGIIESEFRAGSGVLEPWNSDSRGASQRLESTLQSVRRRATISIKPAENGMLRLSVRVEKEIEDVPGEVARFEGGATFSESAPLNRDLTRTVGQSGSSVWIPAGRDLVLEGELASQILGKPPL